ncbi:MAG TPA: NAD(P)H-binding protein [Propionibacteriaceae bacterium]
MTILVTGATGQLGTPTAAALRSAGQEVRAMSRRVGPDLITADLLTGAGVTEALTGVDTVVHLATTAGAKDVQVAERLIEAAQIAQVRHLVVISIVGIERIPLGYYRDRVRIEELVAASGIAFTLQRATQFHSLVAKLFDVQRRSPVLLAPSIRFQPIAVTEVAERLSELTMGDPQGRVEDIGGPEVRITLDLAQAWLRASGLRRRVLPVRLPGRVFDALASGANLVSGEPYGRETFEAHLAHRSR